MPTQRKLIACRIFADELLASGAIPEDTEIVWIDAALHEDYKMLEEQIRAALSSVEKGPEKVHLLFGSGCHPDINSIAAQYNAKASPVANCLEAFCGERKRQLEQNRTMIMTPAWVRAYPDMMKILGWDEVDIRINLGRFDRILVVDTGVNPLSDEEIMEFFDLTQVVIEQEQIDLEHFKGVVSQILTSPED